MKKIILTLLVSFVFVGLYAQDFKVPADYDFKSEGYEKYNEEILQACDWLMNTPINKKMSKRKEVNTFFIEWLTGCTHVSIGLDARIVNFTEKNPDLLIIFMTGWTKQVLNTNDNKDRIKGNLAGVEAVIEFYLKNKDYLQKDKNVEKYIKMRDKGKLEEHIESIVQTTSTER